MLVMARDRLAGLAGLAVTQPHSWILVRHSRDPQRLNLWICKTVHPHADVFLDSIDDMLNLWQGARRWLEELRTLTCSKRLDYRTVATRVMIDVPEAVGPLPVT